MVTVNANFTKVRRSQPTKFRDPHSVHPKNVSRLREKKERLRRDAALGGALSENQKHAGLKSGAPRNPCRTEVQRSQSAKFRDPLYGFLENVSRRREKKERLRRDAALGGALSENLKHAGLKSGVPSAFREKQKHQAKPKTCRTKVRRSHGAPKSLGLRLWYTRFKPIEGGPNADVLHRRAG